MSFWNTNTELAKKLYQIIIIMLKDLELATFTLLAAITPGHVIERRKMRRIIHGATEGTNGISTTSRQYKRRLKEEVMSKETGDANYTHVLFYILLAAFVVASLVTRLYKLNEPTHIA